MPIYGFPVQPRGDQYIYGGISGLGDDVAKAIDSYQKREEQDALNQDVMKHALDRGDITLDDYNKFKEAPHPKQTGMAGAMAANWYSDMKRQSAGQEQQLRGLQIQDMQSKANQTGPYAADPDQVAIQRAQAAHLAAQTQLAQAQAQNLQTGGDEAVQVDPVKVGEKDVPGVGVNRKTGAFLYFAESGLVRDPGTGSLGVKDTKGNFKPLNAAQITAMAMDPNNPVQQSAPGQPPAPGLLSKAWGALTGATGQSGTGTSAAASAGAGKQLDPATAQQLLQETGGDKEKARELAKQRGYVF